MSVVYVFAYPWLASKYRRGFDERRGIYSKSFRDFVRDRHPLWIHAVSVGEVQTALPFIDHVTASGFDRPVILSTTTTTGRQMAEKLFSHYSVRLFYYPWDVPRIIKRAVSTIDPCGYVVVETEIWPDILYEMGQNNIPAFLLNGRFSDKSFEKRKARGTFWKDVLNLYTVIMVREEEDRQKLKALGVDQGKVVLTGDCKVDALLNRADRLDLSQAKSVVGEGGPLLVAGSTHTGEDEMVLEAFRIVRKSSTKARLIIVPRHPERSSAVKEMACSFGKTVLLSENKEKDHNWDILVVDSIGWLFDLYALADAAFVGGSLVPRGGQNILEPALFGVPLFHGPHMEDFREASAKLLEAEISFPVENGSELGKKWLEALDPDKRKEVEKRSRIFFAQVSGAALLSWNIAKKFIKEMEEDLQ
jgi:3-deoxy-D-manno-octulosonic-acid transferase